MLEEKNLADFFENLILSKRPYAIETLREGADEVIFKDVYLYLTGLNVQYFSKKKNDLVSCLHDEIVKIEGKRLSLWIESDLASKTSKPLSKPDGLREVSDQPSPFLSATPPEILEKKLISVHAFTQLIRKRLEIPQLQNVWVLGELSNVTVATSGHAYFVLKDDKAQVSCVIFKSDLRHHKFDLENGLQVEAFGRVSVYEKRGNYQLILSRMVPEGMGELQFAFEQLKKKLSLEGLFDPSKKKPIPAFPNNVGVVTSSAGAALRDILKTTKVHFPRVHLILYPTLVQGDQAAQNIAEQIRLANKHRAVDLLIVGRGGGSTEDLWAFNEEAVARAIFESQLPILSAVGHEIDFSISDLVADYRCPTPTAAAEFVSRGKKELRRKLSDLEKRAALCMEQRLRAIRSLLDRAKADALRFHLQKRHQESVQRIDLSLKDAERALRERLRNVTQEFYQMANKLDALSPLKILSRGYSVVFDEHKKIVREADLLKKNQQIRIQFFKGERKALVQ